MGKLHKIKRDFYRRMDDGVEGFYLLADTKAYVTITGQGRAHVWPHSPYCGFLKKALKEYTVGVALVHASDISRKHSHMRENAGAIPVPCLPQTPQIMVTCDTSSRSAKMI